MCQDLKKIELSFVGVESPLWYSNHIIEHMQPRATSNHT